MSLEQLPVMSDKPLPSSTKPTTGVRHAERRRTATCRFADRVAQHSVDYYQQQIPSNQRPSQTCMATLVAHFQDTQRLIVLSMGVGTKFLSESTLKEEEASSQYGCRVRDCHAEVLARRSFRRRLTLEMLQDLKGMLPEDQSGDSTRILRRSTTREQGGSDDRIRYTLREGVTLHMYTSSAPCGNATLKKFSKMQKEKFLEELGDDEWPKTLHEPIHGHSVKLGQFALLVKKDKANNDTVDDAVSNDQEEQQDDDNSSRKRPRQDSQQGKKGKKAWPASTTDDWCPPGTSIVPLEKGSMHTCSDKICRWNILGIQGSLLTSLLEAPLYMSTLTVGRKLTECICRRAVCCRVGAHWECSSTQGQGSSTTTGDGLFQLNHPAIMGTAVYMDETGVVETNADERGQDVRFHSTLAWTGWAPVGVENDAKDGATLDCIDGATGFVAPDSEDESAAATTAPISSRVSTRDLRELFLEAFELAVSSVDGLKQNDTTDSTTNNPSRLSHLRKLKQQVSPIYEHAKDTLLSKHRVLRQWKRRSNTEDGAK